MMKGSHMLWYALTVGAIALRAKVFGMSGSTILWALIALTCPVMMMFMMGGHGGGSNHGSTDTAQRSDSAGPSSPGTPHI